MGRVSRYFALKALSKKGLKMCSLCDDEVVSTKEYSCIYCEMSAKWGVV